MEHTIIAQQFKFEVVSVHDRFDLLVKATLDRKLQYRVAKKEWPPRHNIFMPFFFYNSVCLFLCVKRFFIKRENWLFCGNEKELKGVIDVESKP